MAFALTEIDLAGGKRNTDLWLVPTAGGGPRRITSSPGSDSRPRWSPDGTRLAFLSAREGGSQVWALDLAGGEPRKLTSLATGADAFEWVEGPRLLVVAEVFPDCGADDACNARKLAEAGKPSSARVYDQLLFRHWDTWDDGRRSHLLVMPVDGGSTEELWFPEWEFGGPYWSSPEGYSRHNPRDFAKNFRTPTLVVHGEKDYRVPVEQGLAMFAALRRQGVPARLVVFPEENHWVLKPANSVRWYDEVLGWLDRWTKK